VWAIDSVTVIGETDYYLPFSAVPMDNNSYTYTATWTSIAGSIVSGVFCPDYTGTASCSGVIDTANSNQWSGNC
jgi:hypothetical protein